LRALAGTQTQAARNEYRRKTWDPDKITVTHDAYRCATDEDTPFIGRRVTCERRRDPARGQEGVKLAFIWAAFS